MQGLGGLVLVLSLPSAAVSFGPAKDTELRVGSWNVYYKALDDVEGQAAIIKTIDTADGDRPFDFFGVVEAQGDSPLGNFSSWPKKSTALSRLAHVSGKSGYEVIGLYYNDANWDVGHTVVGEFEPGRPYLLAQFLPTAATGSAADSTKVLWVMVVHLNHYFLAYPDKIDPVYPGVVMADAFRNASEATGSDISAGSVVMFGDFNEFEWADFPAPYKADAAKRMAPLWDGYFKGRMTDAVPPRTVSCCTKWAADDRATRTEWLFEYDHVFFSDDLATVTGLSPTHPFLDYVYPGTAAPCADPACTGQDPPKNVTTTAQGSWHRAVHASFTRS